MRRDTETDDVPRIGEHIGSDRTDREHAIRQQKQREYLAMAPEQGGTQSMFVAKIRSLMNDLQHESGWTASDKLAFLQGHAYHDGWPPEARALVTLTMVRAVQGEIAQKEQAETTARNKRLPRGIRLTKKEQEELAELRAAMLAR